MSSTGANNDEKLVKARISLSFLLGKTWLFWYGGIVRIEIAR
ncbi:MAG: hypothetical protein N2Z76_00785 [Treponemataceae bacterium]|nr:hypothetical protein [Treponemataceae bacterium]